MRQKGQKGFSLIELLIVVAIIGIIAAIAIPNLLSSRRASNEAAAISNVRTIISAEATYFSTQTSGTYTDLPGLKNNGLVDDKLGNSGTGGAAKSGYWFGVTAVGAGNGSTYVIGAAPDSATTGSRIFSAANDGVIFADLAATYGVGAVPTATAGNPIGN